MFVFGLPKILLCWFGDVVLAGPCVEFWPNANTPDPDPNALLFDCVVVGVENRPLPVPKVGC